MIGYAITGSFCTHAKSLEQLQNFVDSGLEIIPILSETAYTFDTRFGKASDLIDKLELMTGHKVVHTICQAELFGPKEPLDALIISPCTGNTLAKLAQGITDTTVCMAAKAHLRQNRPLLIALASNDALAANLSNIAVMLNKKHVYLVPMCQDDPKSKPHSLVTDFSMLRTAYDAMLEEKQLRPVFL